VERTWSSNVRWIVLILVGGASAGLMAVSVAMNFTFGSSFGRTTLESYAYGAAFGFADILKMAAPIVAARSFADRKRGTALLGLLLWGTFAVCSVVSAIGFASANRTFTVDARKVQAALNQSRLTSLEADQSELRRLRDRLASPEVARTERLQLMASAQRLEAAIGAARGKLEDAAPIVSTPNPQAYTLASLTGASMDQVETSLVLLVALLVEMGGLGPFITMNLAKALLAVKVRAAKEPKPPTARSHAPSVKEPIWSGTRPTRGPRLIFSAAPLSLKDDLGRFLNLQTRQGADSALSSTDLLKRYNEFRNKRALPNITQRRFGDAMSGLGHQVKVRLSGGRTFYRGLAWAADATTGVATSDHRTAAVWTASPRTAMKNDNRTDGSDRFHPKVREPCR
jgi:hypothetical protein